MCLHHRINHIHPYPPSPSQMFIGWWWLYCTLITVVYRGALIAHLSVPSASPAIDSFSQLVEEPGWTWGYEPSYGAGWEWFKLNENPIINAIFQGMEVSWLKRGEGER